MTSEAIRIACAEECGWRYDPASERWWNKAQLEEDESDEVGTMADGLPGYPSNANAALTLIEALAKEGWTCNLFFDTYRWNCTFTERNSNDDFATAPTFSGAVCECFLRVRGRFKEEQP